MNDFAEIDYDSLESVIREQEVAGNGILILGSTGEGLNLSGGKTGNSKIYESIKSCCSGDGGNRRIQSRGSN